jgi:hypothetical protein
LEDGETEIEDETIINTTDKWIFFGSTLEKGEKK